MRTAKLLIAAVTILILGPTAARAATTTHLVQRGSTANVQVSNLSADGCIQIGLNLSATTSVTRSDGTTSAGLIASLFRDDFCNGIFEFGAAFVPLTNELQLGNGNKTATLNLTVPIDTFDLDGNVRTRVVSASVVLSSTSDTTSGMSHARFSNGNITVVSSGHSVTNDATVAGQVSLDGQPLLPDGFAFGSIETSVSTMVDITK
jgi:hypothetical protein